MADEYAPQTWTNGPSGGTPLSASRLNYMESGIAALSATVHNDTLGVSLDPATRPNATAVVFICSTQPTAWQVGTDLWFDFAAGTITPAT